VVASSAEASGADRALAVRRLWERAEALHAVTYFGEETRAACATLGLDGFWLGYFGLRAAPLGRVGAGTVEATFHNFAPAFVRRWVPRVWDLAEPDALLAARADAAAATLDRIAPELRSIAADASELLRQAMAAAHAGGRPLFAANRELGEPADAVASLWHQTTLLREHRGDGHVAALTAAGLTGLEAHVLLAAERGLDPILLQRPRGWDAEQWSAARGALLERDLLGADGGLALSDDGRALRAEVERTTDVLAAAPWPTLEPIEQAIALLDGPARTVAGSDLIPYPNPIGLPPPT
jgi:hypothetical protein